MDNAPQVSIIIPLYNEEATIPELRKRIDALIKKSTLQIEVILINDGSKDKTEELLTEIGNADDHYHIVSLSRNFGHQMAVSAGLSCAQASEAILVIDGDLQDPPELLEDFYKKYKGGYDVIYGIRKKRKENFLKRWFYAVFYRILKSVAVIDVPLDSGDFSLMSRRVVDMLNSMPEESRYLRGMRAWVGFKQIGIEYERDERVAGKTKYSIKDLFHLAYNGIFNFSEFPIKFISKIGLTLIVLSTIYILYAIYRKIFFDDVPQGFTTLIILITLFSGVQLLSLGVIGEYVTRIFMQAKERPLFIIKWQIINREKTSG